MNGKQTLTSDFQLNCPIRGRIKYYSNKYHLKEAISKNRPCFSCSQKGKIISEKQRKEHSEKMKGKNNPNYGRRGKLHPMFGKVGPNKGKKFSDEYKEKLSLSHLGKKQSEETKNKISVKHQGKNNFFYGKRHSVKTKKEMSNSKKLSWKNPEIRKKYYDALSKTKWIKVRTDEGQLELIEKWNGMGFNFQPNYQIHADTDLFYVDGYDKEKNVVLEYDGKYHNSSIQKQKDLVRQNKIIELLKPKKFWRYDAINRQFRNII